MSLMEDTATTSAAATPIRDMADASFDEFESEIARLSQDTDAILDSIRREAQATPKERRRRKKKPASSLKKKLLNKEQMETTVTVSGTPSSGNYSRKEEDQASVNTYDFDDRSDAMTDDDGGNSIMTDQDDDMTDDGSVPDEVRQKIQDELNQLDTKFSTDPDGVSEEILRVSIASFSPLATAEASDELADDTAKVPRFLEDHLLPMVLAVWTAVLLILARVAHTGLLDAEGNFVWPFLLLPSFLSGQTRG